MVKLYLLLMMLTLLLLDLPMPSLVLIQLKLEPLLSKSLSTLLLRLGQLLALMLSKKGILPLAFAADAAEPTG